MPFGIIGRTGPEMRQVAEFGDRSTGRGIFGGEFGERHCKFNQWGLYRVPVRQRRDADLFPNYLGQTCYRGFACCCCGTCRCVWQPKLGDAPNCAFPSSYGYTLSETPVETEAGFTARLRRIANPTLFGNDSESLVVDVTFETDHRVRIRVTEHSAASYTVLFVFFVSLVHHHHPVLLHHQALILDRLLSTLSILTYYSSLYRT